MTIRENVVGYALAGSETKVFIWWWLWKVGLTRSNVTILTFLLFLWLFPSCRVAGITDDLSSPHRPVRLLARSQSSTFQISLTRVFPSCFRSSSLPFPWYIRPQHFPQYVCAISPHHMPVPDQSSLGALFGSLCHSCCSSDLFIPDLVFAEIYHDHCKSLSGIHRRLCSDRLSKHTSFLCFSKMEE